MDNGLTYIRVGDYYIPNLVLDEPKPVRTVGKHGSLRRNYLKQHRHTLNGKSTGRVPAMTGKNRNTMYPGEKKNRTSKTALLNLSFNRAVRLPFAIILLCDRVETNSIKPVSQGKVTG